VKGEGSGNSEAVMKQIILAKARAVVVRALAAVAVLAIYAAGSIGTQVAATVGVSTLALTASAKPAGAWWRRDGGWRGWGWRRGWRRCPWGEWC
jgi:hypothetical protein